MKKVAILAIDLQNDFTSPSGSLYVKGAEKDILNIANFINKNSDKIEYIALTMDSHQPIHIATPSYWEDENHNPPALYTIITSEDVLRKKLIPKFNKGLAYDYLKTLEEKGDICTIWSPHCILGSNGWCINEKVIHSLFRWCIENNTSYELFYKGFHQATEHYSIFKAAVTYEDAPETFFNQQLSEKLGHFDEILIIGEAADYCVASSLNDIIESVPTLVSKTVILTDCMSWIMPDNAKAISIYEKAKIAGIRFSTTENYRFD